MTAAETGAATSGDRLRTMVLDWPDWPVVATGLRNDAGVIVVAANRVVAVSAAARDAGVQIGLRRRIAQQRCPSAEVVDADPARDARAFERVLQVIADSVPRVEVTRPGRVSFPVRGPARYFGGDAAVAARLDAAFCEARVPPARVGVADGPFAAALAAATDAEAKPDAPPGGRYVAAGATPAFLAPLPITALGMPALAEVLGRLGLRTLGAFAALDASDVLGRFGTDGLLAHRRAHGDDPDTVVAVDPPPDATVEFPIDPPADRLETVAFCARPLADELCARLGAAGLVCVALVVEAVADDGTVHARCWRHDDGFGPGAVVERVRWQLDGWLASSRRPTGGIARLRLVPERVRPDLGRQLGLWGERGDADRRAIRGLTRVQGLLGPDAVTTPTVVGGRDPAARGRLVPWDADANAGPVGPAASAGRARPTSPEEVPVWPGQVPAPAPAVVHAPARPAHLVTATGAPVAVGGRGLLVGVPARFRIEPVAADRPGDVRAGPATATGWYEVQAWSAAWPADERWWDPHRHRRSARLQIVTTDGTAHLLAVRDGRWHLEATYG